MVDYHTQNNSNHQLSYFHSNDLQILNFPTLPAIASVYYTRSELQCDVIFAKLHVVSQLVYKHSDKFLEELSLKTFNRNLVWSKMYVIVFHPWRYKSPTIARWWFDFTSRTTRCRYCSRWAWFRIWTSIRCKGWLIYFNNFTKSCLWILFNMRSNRWAGS